MNSKLIARLCSLVPLLVLLTLSVTLVGYNNPAFDAVLAVIDFSVMITSGGANVVVRNRVSGSASSAHLYLHTISSNHAICFFVVQNGVRIARNHILTATRTYELPLLV